MNDRARLTIRFFEPINTLPLVIMIAHDMNNEPMKEIAKRHKLSLSEAYRLCNQARRVFTEGYNREQEPARLDCTGDACDEQRGGSNRARGERAASQYRSRYGAAGIEQHGRQAGNGARR